MTSICLTIVINPEHTVMLYKNCFCIYILKKVSWSESCMWLMLQVMADTMMWFDQCDRWNEKCVNVGAECSTNILI